MTRFLTAAILVCAAVPALGQAPQPAERACLEQINMYGFDPVPGNRALIVTDIRHRRYRVSFMGPCYNLQWHLGVRFKTFGTSNLSCVSRGDQVLLRDAIGPSSCIGQSVEYQTPAMDQADAQAKAAKAAH